MSYWGKVLETNMGSIAVSFIEQNEKNGCSYHNFDHIRSMYEYLTHTNEPYNEALDWAVLFHDIVYDEYPEKEQRSADFFIVMSNKFNEILPEISKDAYDMILATATHELTDKKYSAIIRADLHGLANPVSMFRNFYLIMQESVALYNISEVDFAKNSYDFMHKLYQRVYKTKLADDPEHIEFYLEVLNGIESTLKLAHIIGGYK